MFTRIAGGDPRSDPRSAARGGPQIDHLAALVEPQVEEEGYELTENPAHGFVVIEEEVDEDEELDDDDDD